MMSSVNELARFGLYRPKSWSVEDTGEATDKRRLAWAIDVTEAHAGWVSAEYVEWELMPPEYQDWP